MREVVKTGRFTNSLSGSQHWSALLRGRVAVPQADRQAVTHETRVSITITAKIAATTPSAARGTMPIQYAGIGSSR